jgi:PIN domain nuclease of toxin-antitoxin system
MRILLDTHIYLWWLQDDPRLSSACKGLIVAASDVFISSATIRTFGHDCRFVGIRNVI